MKHTYAITGMTCEGCKAKVSYLLSHVAGVKEVDIDLPSGVATVTMDKHIDTLTLKTALKEYPKYQLSEKPGIQSSIDKTENKSWLVTYKPILLIFGYITMIALISATLPGGFDTMLAMRVFMSGFFLTFSFFKLLDLNGFADSYAMYDVVAKRFKGWGYLYAFIELGLGIAYAINLAPVITHSITLVVMTISIIGVLQSVLNKQKIRCACLGAVFNLPMSTVTIIEDALMIFMSSVMLIGLL
jgi:copper chaperone CopZ